MYRVVLLLLVFAFAQTTQADHPGGFPIPDPNDAFDMSKGTVIKSFSKVYPGFSADDALGGKSTTYVGEEGHTIFIDNEVPPDNTDFIEFETKWLVRLSGYRMWAQGDILRHTAIFRLRADLNNDGNYETLISEINAFVTNASQTITLPAPITARKFKMELVRATPISGPRIMELDAITPENPGPNITWIKPEAGSTFEEPATVPIEFTVDDPDCKKPRRLVHVCNDLIHFTP
jgi:hypothetical protein